MITKEEVKEIVEKYIKGKNIPYTKLLEDIDKITFWKDDENPIARICNPCPQSPSKQFKIYILASFPTQTKPKNPDSADLQSVPTI